MRTRKIAYRQDGHPHTPFTWHHSLDNPSRCDGDYFVTKWCMDLLIGVCSCKDENGRYREFIDCGEIGV